MSRDVDLQRARVDLYAEALRNRLARGWSPDLDALALYDAECKDVALWAVLGDERAEGTR